MLRSAHEKGDHMTRGDAFDYAVIGGGLVGVAIAYGLARRDKRVIVLDEGDNALRASRGNFGLVWVQGKGQGLPAYSSWTQLSARLWPQFAGMLRDEAGVDVALEQAGGFHICLSEAEMRARVDALGKLMAQPGFETYEVQTLDRRQLQTYYPGIGSDAIGGTYSALDGHLNPLKLFRALHLAVQRRGAAYRPNAAVTGIMRDASWFVLACADGKTVHAQRVVLAAGLGNARLAPMLDIELPVRPQRGQILVLERIRRFMDHPVVTLRQTDEGTVLIGDSQEEAGFDDCVSTTILATLADRAVRTFPALGDARVVRTWGALRVMSPDGFPVYTQSRVQPGAFGATCHSGVTLAAVHALVLAPQIIEGNLGASLAPFAPTRFQPAHRNVEHV
jgi:hydrogen cyanide synthase HcnC